MFVSFYRPNNYIIRFNRSLISKFFDEKSLLEFLNIPKNKTSKGLLRIEFPRLARTGGVETYHAFLSPSTRHKYTNN